MSKKRRQPQLCPRLFSYPCAIKNATPRESARSEDAVPSKTSLTILPGGSEPAKKKSGEFPLVKRHSGLRSVAVFWHSPWNLERNAPRREEPSTRLQNRGSILFESTKATKKKGGGAAVIPLGEVNKIMLFMVCFFLFVSFCVSDDFLVILQNPGRSRANNKN